MHIKTVAILSPGDMGHAVGRALKEHGVHVVTCLRGRSERTRGLANRAGIEDLSSMEKLVTRSDLILSVVVPAEAVNLAQRVAEALRNTGAGTYFADCNAVSPQTAETIDSIITKAGGRFIDASIIGSPPGKGEPPRLYASGPYGEVLSQLDGMGIRVRPVGGNAGKASGIKMCYAAFTKGSQALWVALLTAAEVMGLSEELRQEFESGQASIYARMQSQVPRLAVKARRWVGEMEEIAATFERVGVTPYFHKGAADICRFVATTPLAQETPETLNTTRTLEQTLAVFREYLLKAIGQVETDI